MVRIPPFFHVRIFCSCCFFRFHCTCCTVRHFSMVKLKPILKPIRCVCTLQHIFFVSRMDTGTWGGGWVGVCRSTLFSVRWCAAYHYSIFRSTRTCDHTAVVVRVIPWSYTWSADEMCKRRRRQKSPVLHCAVLIIHTSTSTDWPGLICQMQYEYDTRV